MTHRPDVTEAQKYAMGPWVVALFASFGIALFSYVGLVAYLFMADRKELWLIVLWVGGTALGWRAASRYCQRRIDEILDTPSSGAGRKRSRDSESGGDEAA